jgi:serine/threonine-protein kinase HipA
VNRQLMVYTDNGVVGTLLENEGAWSFQYAESWIANHEGFDLSPTLKRQSELYVDNGSARPVQWFFDNLLPEEDLRVAIAKAEGLSANDSWGLLEHFGKESFGSLSFGKPSQTKGLRELSNAELEQRIKDLPRKPITTDSPKKMSMAGAQHKLLVVYREGRLYEPSGGEVSTHILKPNHPHKDQYPDTVINEYFCMALARKIGLPVPDLHVLRVPSPVYVVKRFDRVSDQAAFKRVHALDGAQLLSMDGRLKYGIDAHSLKRCIDLCMSKLKARRQIFQWTIFNLLIGNSDAHIKNISFMATPGGFDIAPMYDLVSTASYATRETGAHEQWPDVDLSMQIGNSRRYSDVTYLDLFEFAESIGLPEKAARVYLLDMLLRVKRDSGAMEEELMGDHNLSASEKRRVRLIQHLVINEMVEKLTPPKRSADIRM